MLKLSVTELARPVIPFPSLLVTRASGRQFWEKLKSHLHYPQSDNVAMLSFAGIEVMDASFADEVFGTLGMLRARREEQFLPIILADVNETCQENLHMALETRPDREPSSQERLRNCVLPVLTKDGVQLTGKVEEHILQSFNLLRTREVLTAREIADALKLNLNAASTRLKTLSDLGLALRTEVRDAQGKQYIYRKLY